MTQALRTALMPRFLIVDDATVALDQIETIHEIGLLMHEIMRRYVLSSPAKCDWLRNSLRMRLADSCKPTKLPPDET